MIELVHGQEPIELTEYNANYPAAVPSDFDSHAEFKRIKQLIKQALYRDQGGLCVYCERKLEVSEESHIEHIKPKAAQQPTQQAFPALAFTYTNFAHSCINDITCGQKKKSGILPIEPAPNCNAQWVLQSDGCIEPILGLTNRQKHLVAQTRDMLGLNKDTGLVTDRADWFQSAVNVAQEMPEAIDDFLAQSPFRYILQTVFR
jgi:uncharacterized protein (TIGR02646 family)